MPDHNIREEILALAVDVATLKTHPRNYRRGDIPTIAESLAEHGQYKPVVVRKTTMEICAGNHTFLAASQELGWTQVAAVVLDIDEDTALRILAVDNAASDKAVNDDTALAELLSELADTELGLDATGYDTAELDLLRARIAADSMPLTDPYQEWEGMPHYENQDQTSWHRVVVHFQEQEHLDTFATLIDQDVTKKTHTIYFPESTTPPVDATAHIEYVSADADAS